MPAQSAGAIVLALPHAALGGALVLCRVGAAVAAMPALGEASLPMMVRAAMALLLTATIAPVVLPTAQLPQAMSAACLATVLREIATGLLLGWTARLAVIALPSAGQLVSVATGLTSVLQPDPELGSQSSALASLFLLAVPVLLFTTGLYRLPIEALCDSYHLFRLGTTPSAGDAAPLILGTVSQSFALALRIASPFLVAATLWQCLLDLVSRFVPSLQATIALAPGQILGGMFLLAVLLAAMLGAWQDAMGIMLARFVDVT